MNDPAPAQNRTESDREPVEAPSGVGTAEGAREARGDTAEQVANRIAMWTAEILNPDRDERIEASTQTLLRSLVADVRTLERMTVDAEVAAAVSEAQAEVERLREALDGCREQRADLLELVAQLKAEAQR